MENIGGLEEMNETTEEKVVNMEAKKRSGQVCLKP